MTQQRFTLWFTGPGAGQSAVLHLVAQELRARGLAVPVLESDVRSLDEVGETPARNGVVAIASADSPDRALRAQLYAGLVRLLEVRCETSDDEDEGSNDRDDPDQARPGPHVTIYPERETADYSAAKVLQKLELLGYLPPPEEAPEGEEGSGEVAGRLRALGYIE